MRPGKLFTPTEAPIKLYPTTRTAKGLPEKSSTIGIGGLFFVVAVDLDKKFTKVVNYHDLRSPWLVLYKEEVWLAEFYGRSIIDLTPWAPWEEGYKHNSDLLECFKQYVVPCSD